MHFLDKLRNNRIYVNRRLLGLDSEIEDKRRGQLIIHIGNDAENDIVDFLKCNLFQQINFRSFYTPRMYISENRRYRRIYRQSPVYKDIQERSGRSLRVKLQPEQYAGYNLIVDATKMYHHNNTSLMNKKNFFKNIDSLKYAINQSNIKSYKQVLLYFNVDSLAKIIDTDPLNIRANKNPLSILKYCIRRNLGFDLDFSEDQNVSLMVGSPSKNSFIKLDLMDWNELFRKRNLFFSRLGNLMDGVSGRVELVDEPDEVSDDSKSDSNLAKDGQSDIDTPAEDPKTSNVDPETKVPEIPDFKEKVEIEKTDKILEISDKIIGKATITSKDNAEKVKEIIADKVESSDEEEVDVREIFKDDETIDEIIDVIDSEVIGQSNLENKKAYEKLLQQQEKALNSKEKFASKLNKTEKNTIKRTEISQVVTINKEVKESMTVNDFDTSYMDQKFTDDLVGVFKGFNEDDKVPVFINKIDMEDSSDSQSQKDTIKVQLKDDKNITHNITIDVPKVYDGKYIKVNGGKKIIQKQLVMLPIVKTKPTEVWITTNYNKIIMERFGRKNNIQVNYIEKLFGNADFKNILPKPGMVRFSRGNSEVVNSKYNVSSSYLDFSKFITVIQMNNYLDIQLDLQFNQEKIRHDIDALGYSVDYDEYYPVGYNHKTENVIVSKLGKDELYEVSLDGKATNINKTLPVFIIELLNTITNGEIESIISTSVRANENLTYSRCNIVNRNIPTVIIVAGEIGLKETLKRAGIKYEFTSVNTRYSIIENKGKIKFADGYLIYDSGRLPNTMLLAGLKTLDTTQYNFADMESKEPYLDYYAENYNSRNVSKGVSNALSLMIDPMTKEVLEDLGQPTNIYDVLLFANAMLEDLSSKSFNDMSIYRIRGAEQVSAVLYKMMAESYKNYKDSHTNKNPIKMSLPKDALIKELLKVTTVDESSDLNPSLELDKTTSVTYKGPAGRNSDNTYTDEIRGFDKSMQGILGVTSPDSNKVGVVRQISYGSNINGTRGYLDTGKSDITQTSEYSALEMLNPFTSRHADVPRLGMTSTQSKHIIATETNDLPLISSGVEKTIAYQISDTFAIKAKKDGKVIKVDNRNGLLFVDYTDGSKDVFDIEPKMNKNSNGGFYAEQRLNVLIKEGDQFDKGDILAKNDGFFKEDGKGNISYVQGKLSKIAIHSGSSLYEDSSLITSSMSKKMASKITMKKPVSIGKKANIQFLVQEGQKIKTGQPLVIFEPEFGESEVNELLAKVGDEFSQDIEEMTNKMVKSKYTGRVAKINVFYNRPLEEFSPSVRKVIEDYKAKYDRKTKAIEKVSKSIQNKSLSLDVPTTEMIKSDKIHGEEVDGLLLEIFVEYNDELSVGDKISFYTALKTVISDVIPSSQHPYTKDNKNEEIEAVLSPLSIVSRMVPDVYQMMMGNKVLIELKRQIKDIVK